MRRSVWNEKLDYEVDVTADVWRGVIAECQERKSQNEEVDLIIGVDGTPMIIPTHMPLRRGEWESSLRCVIDGIHHMRLILDFPIKWGARDVLQVTPDDQLSQIIAYLSVTGDGIVARYRTLDRRDAWEKIYRESYDMDVISYLREHRTDSRYSHVYGRIMERHDYDIIHNTQYIIDYFGYSANGQYDEIKTPENDEMTDRTTGG